MTDSQIIATLTAALQFYGRPQTWRRDNTVNPIEPSPAYRDEGARARLALRAVGIEPTYERAMKAQMNERLSNWPCGPGAETPKGGAAGA